MTMLPMAIERQQCMGSVIGKSCLRIHYGPNANGDEQLSYLWIKIAYAAKRAFLSDRE